MPSPKKVVTFKDARRILSSIYPELALRINPEVNKIRTNLLHENLNGRDPKTVVRSILKPLDPDQQPRSQSKHPLSKAFDFLPERRVYKRSNILLFRSRNQLLDISDFKKLAPKEDSLFDLAQDYTFKIRRGRAKDTLQERSGYYLIFPTVQEAAAYNVDTLGKQLNGVNFYLEMVNPEKDYVYFNSHLFFETFEMSGDVLKLKSEFPRENCVLIKGLPTFIKQETLSKMLYDYQVDYESGGIVPIEKDNFAQLTSWLIRFESPLDAQRFVRNHNGFHLNHDPRHPKIYADVLS